MAYESLYRKLSRLDEIVRLEWDLSLTIFLLIDIFNDPNPLSVIESIPTYDSSIQVTHYCANTAHHRIFYGCLEISTTQMIALYYFHI